MSTIIDNGNAYPRCEHVFVDGLCTKCACPETEADTDRAIRMIQAKRLIN